MTEYGEVWARSWRDGALWHFLCDDQPYESSARAVCGVVLVYPLNGGSPDPPAKACPRCEKIRRRRTQIPR